MTFMFYNRILVSLALVVWAGSGVGQPVHAAVEDAERFAKQMLDYVGVVPLSCPDDAKQRYADRVVVCAVYGGHFSAWKSEWQFHLERHNVEGESKPGSSWTLSKGRYTKDFIIEDHEVRVSFDKTTHLVVMAYVVEGDESAPAAGPALVGLDPGAPPPPRMAGFGGVGTPKLIEESRVEPEYPIEAQEFRVEGKVALQVVVYKDGSVGPITVLSQRPDDRGFAEAAAIAVQEWLYEPATFEGQPVDVTLPVYIDFELSED